MTIQTRQLSAVALATGLVFGAAACDDDDNGGGGVTTSTVTTTSNTLMPTTTSSNTSHPPTSSSTSVSSTTTSSTTMTTIIVEVCPCNVTWSVTSADTLGSLQYDTDYSAAGGSFKGSGTAVNCTALAGDFTAFNDVEASQTLSTATISTAGFTGPIDVSECAFLTDNPALAPSDFTVTITDQSAPDFTPTNATMEISSVNCVCTGATTSTTTSTTTTTTTTTITSTITSTTSSTDTTKTSMGPASIWDIEFSLDDAVTLGALQYTVDYRGAGDFVGLADMVACTSPLSAGGAFVTFNDEDVTMNLNFAAVALAGFAGPTIVANCEFVSAAVRGVPIPGDFVITVVDAADPALNPVVPLPVISVSGVTRLQ